MSEEYTLKHPVAGKKKLKLKVLTWAALREAEKDGELKHVILGKLIEACTDLSYEQVEELSGVDAMSLNRLISNKLKPHRKDNLDQKIELQEPLERESGELLKEVKRGGLTFGDMVQAERLESSQGVCVDDYEIACLFGIKLDEVGLLSVGDYMTLRYAKEDFLK